MEGLKLVRLAVRLVSARGNDHLLAEASYRSNDSRLPSEKS
jgi:hypothetical protein